MFQSRVVIPKKLQSDILQRLHQGHQGIVKCRALAKISVWWPGLSKSIESMVKNCATCEKGRTLHPEPLKPTPTPDYPWQRIGTDLFELNGHQYLAIVDYFSRWVEIAHLKKTSSQATIEHMKSIFARQGIPECVVSDNGPQYDSREFRLFSQEYGFTHLTSSPYHPEGNGEAERAVQTVKNLLKKAKDPYIALMNYRATPLAQGLSPAELLNGRQLRTRIPTHPSRYIPKPLDQTKFREADYHQKMQQKANFDRRHRARSLSPLPPGQQVWIKHPRPCPAEVTTPSTPTRSYPVKTSAGTMTRRNRHQLRRRSRQQQHQSDVPRSSATLPATEERIPDQEPLDPTPAFGGDAAQTRSGRIVKPRERLHL
ncbi:hypothetical protein V1264_005660 [Littorina saxatilis]|uniref:Integrase catalytic domain-containing protein n=1 Tax=Littorina saxatilis TaxID=31220 RepID=A0AAN9B009_9CAEN